MANSREQFPAELILIGIIHDIFLPRMLPWNSLGGPLVSRDLCNYVFMGC